MVKKLKFNNTTKSSFLATTRSRVDDYFKNENVSRFANKPMWIKAFFFMSTFFILYGLIISNFFNIWSMLIFAGLLGMSSAFVGFNICHDAIHSALSSHHRINKLFSFLFNLVGANPYVWSITHNIVHHT